MPWAHCESEDIADDAKCPECDLTKDAWTVEFDATREFSVKRPPCVRISLQTRGDDPVAEEPYRVELPDGEVVEGELDEDGLARIPAPSHGDVRIAFPNRTRADVALERDEDAEESNDAESGAEESGAEGSGEEEPAADEPAEFSGRTRGRNRFRLRAGVLVQLELQDRFGECYPDVRWQIEDGDGNVLAEGTADDEGKVRAELPDDTTDAKLLAWLSERLEQPTMWGLRIGDLPPVEEEAGLNARLKNLGFHGEASKALKQFQLAHGIKPSGEADEETKRMLKQVHKDPEGGA